MLLFKCDVFMPVVAGIGKEASLSMDICEWDSKTGV